MRAKQSFTALEPYPDSDPFTPPVSMRTALASFPSSHTIAEPSVLRRGSGTESLLPPTLRPPLPAPSVADNEGLLHDARNLMGALGLYCDLLSMPGVLKPEHSHYADEVRLLGERSVAMIQQLMEARLQPARPGLPVFRHSGIENLARPSYREPADTAKGLAAQSVSLKVVLQRCSGLLNRVAAGKAIEISYGPAAAIPIDVDEEAVERIMVNLVRNAAAALDKSERIAGASAIHASNAIRIGVGHLINRVGDPRPWPFRRVRLTVEDSGCGMSAEQLERLLSTGRAPARGCHGIGFRVVRELVAASSGDLRVMSTPGNGTCVQIEWPIVPPISPEPLQSSETPEGSLAC